MPRKVSASAAPSSAASMFSGSSDTPISGGEFNNAGGDFICVKIDINHGDRQSSVEKTGPQAGTSSSQQAIGGGVCESLPHAKGKGKLVTGGADDHREMSQPVIEGVPTYPSPEVLGGGDDVNNKPIICLQKQENIWPRQENHYSDTNFGDHDEPEITSLSLESVDSCSTETLPKVVQYSRLLMPSKLGYPLYCPEPNAGAEQTYREEGVLMGDIGHVNFLGEFDVALNIYSFRDLSVSLRSLDLHQDHPVTKQNIDPGTMYCSQDVHSEHFPQRRLFRVKCKSSDGAFLALPEGGILLDAKNKGQYMNLAACHAESWYKYIIKEKQWDVENGALFLVTGCMKSKQWGITTFDEHSLEGSGALHLSSPFWRQDNYKWRPVIPNVTKTGPTSKDIPKDSLNQCTFIRGYRIMLRDVVYKRLQPTTCVPSDAGSSSEATRVQQPLSTLSNTQDHSSGHAGQGQGAQSSSYMARCTTSSTMEYEDPSDVINKILLQEKPGAKIALTHSDDLNDVLANNGMLDPTSLSNKIRECIEFHEEHSCVTISVKDTMSQSQPVNYPQSDIQVMNPSKATLPPQRSDHYDPYTLTPTMPNLASSTFMNQRNWPGDLSSVLSTTLQLLSILKDLKKSESSTKSSYPTSLNLMCKLFSWKLEHIYDTVTVLSDPSDTKNLLDFIFQSLQLGGINSEIKQQTRQFMLRVGTEKHIIPESLIVTGIWMPVKGNPINSNVYKGEVLAGGEVVALKRIFNDFDNDVAFSSCREPLIWGSLHHKFVLQLLGIYQDKRTKQSFLVSPYMENGTLAQWRKNANPSTAEVEQRILEVAKGLEYIHSEGVVHGGLHGANILLDTNLHVQIAGFGSAGLTSEVTYNTTRPRVPRLNFLAPELFGNIPIKTQKSDVYAFGCLYYEIHYDFIPFANKTAKAIIDLHSKGLLPSRLPAPPLSDEAWTLICNCWQREASNRPEIKEVTEKMMVMAISQSVVSTSTPDARDPPYASSSGLESMLGTDSHRNKDLSATLKARLEFYDSPDFSHPDRLFPRTQQDDENIDVLTMWQNITINAKFKDADLNKLYDGIISRAKYDGTKIVLEPRDVRYILRLDEVTAGPGL